MRLKMSILCDIIEDFFLYKKFQSQVKLDKLSVSLPG